jgi:hypothetical protein
MNFSGLQLIGIILASIMIIMFYRNLIISVLKTPKESLLLMLPIILLGIVFFLFFKSKGF